MVKFDGHPPTLGKVTKMGDFVGVEDVVAAPCRISDIVYDVVDCIIVGVCVYLYFCEDIEFDVNIEYRMDGCGVDNNN